MFYTRYSLPERKLREYSTDDTVDRLSYVDTATCIARFMRAGRDLRYMRAQAVYKDVSQIGDEDGTETPVYASDPVEIQARIDALSRNLGKSGVSPDDKDANVKDKDTGSGDNPDLKAGDDSSGGADK